MSSSTTREKVSQMGSDGTVGDRSPDDLLAVEHITVGEYRRLLPRAKPLPPEHELDDAECHNCGEPWNGDDWDEQHFHGGPSIGEGWKFKCPNCGFQTFECGT